MSTGDPNRKRKGHEKRKEEADAKGNQRKPSPHKNTKITGERSEAGFLCKAAYLEFGKSGSLLEVFRQPPYGGKPPDT